MIDVKESIRIFKEKFLSQGIELTNQFNSLVGEAIVSVQYVRNWDGEEPFLIENGKCHHIPCRGINLGFKSGKSVRFFESNSFSEYGGTNGIDIRELKPDEVLEYQQEQSEDINWVELKGKKIQSVKVLWLDDDGWSSPREIDGQVIMVPNEQSEGIFPHGIEMIFENGKVIYILAIEPDEFIKSENRYNYLIGGDEFVIAFDKDAAINQQLIIKGIALEI